MQGKHKPLLYNRCQFIRRVAMHDFTLSVLVRVDVMSQSLVPVYSVGDKYL